MGEEEKIEGPQTTDDGPPEEIIREEKAVPASEQISEPLNDLNSTNDTMEVHKHPHHVTHKKKWGEYLLEFLMIFLAVTLGFFAESYREHLVEKKKEKEIITALFNDIKKDTANLNTIINLYMPEHQAWADSLEAYITSLPIKGNDKIFARALVNATNWNFYSPPQVSLEILKNSGTFSLVKSKEIKSEIINFNGLVNTYVNYSQFVLAAEHAMDTATAGIINRSALRILLEKVYLKTNATYGSISESDVPGNCTLKTYDKNAFQHYMNKLDAMAYLLTDLLGLYKKVLNEEIILLNVLNKEYHLENE